MRCRPGRFLPRGRGLAETAPVNAGRLAAPEEPTARTVLGEVGDDRFGEPAGRGLDGTHLVQQLAGGGPVARELSQAAPDQLPQFGGHAVKVGGAC